jgi:hypothetical protein
MNDDAKGGAPPVDPEGEERYVSCPTCTMQVPASADRCPHCAQTIFRPSASPSSRPGRRGAPPPAGERFAFLPAPLRPYALWVVIGAGVAASLAALFLVYRVFVAVELVTSADPTLPIRAEVVKDGDRSRVRGSVTNLGEDVPDFSLKSIRVSADFLYRDGRKESLHAFPRNPYRGEGSLLREEAGAFEFDVPAKGLKSVRLSASVVDLSLGRTFLPGRGAPPGTAPPPPADAGSAAAPPAAPPAGR